MRRPLDHAASYNTTANGTATKLQTAADRRHFGTGFVAAAHGVAFLLLDETCYSHNGHGGNKREGTKQGKAGLVGGSLDWTWTQEIRVQSLTLPRTPCVTLGESLCPSVFQFLICKIGVTTLLYLTGKLWG